MKRITGISNINLLMIAVVLLLTGSCKKDKDETEPPVEHKLGDNYQGGIIFLLMEAVNTV